MITAVSKEGIKRRLWYNVTFDLVNNDDSFQIIAEDPQKELATLTVNISFSDEGKELGYKGEIKDNILDLTLSQWNNPNGSWLSQPIIIGAIVKGIKKSLWVKFSTSASNKSNYRQFNLSLWIEM